MSAEPIAEAIASPVRTVGVPPLLETRDLSVHFKVARGRALGGGSVALRAVDRVSIEVRRNRTLGLVGESGSGKSTLGRAIVRLLRPTSGSILLDGQDIAGLEGRALRAIRGRLQMVFQDPAASLDPTLSVGSSVAEPLELGHWSTPAGRRARVDELLGQVGLRPIDRDRYPHELSGGQRQRVGIARALAMHPELVVADEPVSALDVSVRAQILALLRDLQQQLGLTLLFVSHDLAVIRQISDDVAVMYLGRIMEGGPGSRIFARPLHPYTVALMSAIPVPDPEVESGRRRIILVGEVPSSSAAIKGCRFASRCWLRTRLGDPERCTEEEPALRPLEADHVVACHFAESMAEHEPRAGGGVPDVPGARAAVIE
jgi:oligopeptide/dipeptide ABC transporter ATP-binding protein